MGRFCGKMPARRITAKKNRVVQKTKAYPKKISQQNCFNFFFPSSDFFLLPLYQRHAHTWAERLREALGGTRGLDWRLGAETDSFWSRRNFFFSGAWDIQCLLITNHKSFLYTEQIHTLIKSLYD